jgi:hypothetical protein
MATGLVELIGTVIGSTGSESGTAADERDKAFDGDLSTFYSADSANGDWCGIDAGSACTVTAYLFCPRMNTVAKPAVDLLTRGGKIQASSASDFSSDVTDCDTIPSFPFYSPRWLNRRATTSPPSKRYWRYLGPDGARCNIAELVFIASAGPSSARPCRPSISPWGGGYTSNPTVTLTSETTSASLYYTTDGSTPDNTDTLYAGPFTLTVGATTTLKVVAYDASLDEDYSAVSTATFHDHHFAPEQHYTDDRGNRMQAHNCGHMQYGGNTYRIGTDGSRGSDFDGGLDTNGSTGFNLYRLDSNFRNPTFIRHILDLPVGVTRVLRGHAIFNTTDNRWVGWCRSWNENTACVFVSDGPDPETATWSWDSADAGIADFADNHAFKRSNGTGYVFYQSSTDNIKVIQLTADYTETTGAAIEIPGTSSESPAVFERDDVIFLFGSQLFSYDSETHQAKDGYWYCDGDPMTLANWKPAEPVNAIYPIPAAGTDYNLQPTDVVFLDGDEDKPVVVCDRWFSGADGMYESWTMPLQIRVVGRVQLKVVPAAWDVSDAFTHNPVAANAIQDQLTAYWRFSDNSGDALDALETYDLTQTGTVGNNSVARGAVHNARGPTNSNDYFVSTDAVFNVNGHTALTWFGTFRMPVVSGFPLVGGRDDISTNRQYGVYINSAGPAVVGFTSTNGSAVTEASKSVSLVEGDWYFFALVHDPDLDKVFFYCAPCTDDGSGTLGDPAEAAFAGGLFNGSAEFRVGIIQGGAGGLRAVGAGGFIAGTALSAADVAIIFNGGEVAAFEDLAEVVASGAFGVFESRLIMGA